MFMKKFTLFAALLTVAALAGAPAKLPDPLIEFRPRRQRAAPCGKNDRKNG